ncbi:hypothetical protein DM860_011714 [Cuscuta australis]|uniref:Fibronectin type III-like domain-containing protein n=1 Tax=Cuscuta australis TaxID=267555 RepID=A0A328DFB7_9ASTE|nr:hypothetical protein DM860_011714 [Cuscuta australis]
MFPNYPLLLFFFFQTSLISTNSQLQLPCTPPYHNGHRFCNTSLPIAARVRAFVSLLTVDEKIPLLCDNSSAVPRLGVPAYQWWSESLHGIGLNGPGANLDGVVKRSTIFPNVIGTVSSFNRTLWRSVAAAVAVQARALHNLGQAGLTFWAPTINVYRDPRWGRGQETPGEDPFVASVYGVEYVKGLQGKDLMRNDDRLMLSACCKHLAAYDMEHWHDVDRFNFNAIVTRQDMEETYQPPFKSCIMEGGATCIMCSYNEISGVPACANRELLDRARSDWGFKGYVASDCDAVSNIFNYLHYTRTPEEASAIALKSGTDVGCRSFLRDHMKAAYEKGIVEESDIDRALVNLYTVQFRLGLFDGAAGNRRFANLGPQDVCSPEHSELALEAARQGIVLLKNENGFLPWDKSRVSSLAVIGPTANTTYLGGDYSGNPCLKRNLYGGFPEYVKNVSYASGCRNVACNATYGFPEAVAAARAADYVVAVLGLDLTQESEYLDRSTLLLPGNQMALVKQLAAVCRNPLVLVLTGGGPLDVSFARDDPRVGSILWIGYPGEEGRRALTHVIFGEYNPGGKLSVTWYPESFIDVPMIDMNMRADPSRDYPGRTYRFYTGEKVYEFGHGLSYTNFSKHLLSAPSRISLSESPKKNTTATNNNKSSKISGSGQEYQNPAPRSRNLSSRWGNNIQRFVLVDEVSHCESLAFTMTVSVKNEGYRDGSDVVMLFSRAPRCYEQAPLKQLIGFDKVHVPTMGSVEVGMSVNPCERLSIVNEEGSRILPLGDHTLILGEKEYVISVEI